MKENLFAFVFLATSVVSFIQYAFGEEQGQIVLCKVEGLSCPFCAYKIEAQLQKLDGVQDIKVDLSKAEVTLTYDFHREIDKSQITQAITKSGFKATEVLLLSDY